LYKQIVFLYLRPSFGPPELQNMTHSTFLTMLDIWLREVIAIPPQYSTLCIIL